MKKYLALAFMAGSITLNANYLTPDMNMKQYYTIYQEGIYDSYIQIQRFINSGINRTELKSLNGKIVVATTSDNLPINKIIYYSTLGQKNFFPVQTAYNDRTKKGYIVFNAYDREADANFAVSKLRKIGVPAVKIFNGKWYSNPVIVKSIIEQLKNNALADFPVKVIVKERIIYKEVPKVVIKYKYIDKEKAEKKKELVKKIVKNDKERLRKLITLIGHLKREAKPITGDGFIGFEWKGKTYKKGDHIEDFTITDARIKIYIDKKNCRKYKKVIFRFDDYYKYHLVFRELLNPSVKPICNYKKNKKTTSKKKKEKHINNNPLTKTDYCHKDKSPEETTNNKPQAPVNDAANKNNQAKNKTGNTNQNSTVFYKCDFTKVRALADDNLKLVLINNTPYAGAGILTVVKLKEINKDGQVFVKFQKNGLTPLYMRKEQWETVCKKQ